MKKYLVLFAFVFVFALFGFNTKPVSAYDAGCMPGDLFSRTTGQSCSALPPACSPGDLFSSLTGQPCSPTTIGSTSSVVVSSVSPTSGAVGTSVVITGSGFTSTNNTVDFGGGYLNGFSSTNGSTITFTVPSSISGCPSPSFGSQAVTACPDMLRVVTAGNYDVSVINANGKSQTISFSVTGLGTLPEPQPIQPTKINPLAPVVSGVSGPQTLNVGAPGTWTVSASDPSKGNLSYSVSWGDSVTITPVSAAIIAPVTQQSATFTHTYTAAGIYNPIFTVTDVSGLTAQTSLSVNVGGVITPVSSPTSPAQPCNNLFGSTCPPTQSPTSPAQPQPVETNGGSGSGSASGNGTPSTQTSSNSTSPLTIPSPNCTISGVLGLGSTGTNVACLQERLGLQVDGKFGPQTKAAVSAFQSKMGLTPDGIFGPKSIPVLLNSASTTTQ
ncbi:MAG: peptidoglycan-binding protein [Candidatus Pacebacteria bacterium]|nr:peptidoglycan-binding protein [Candidatus Paceibacterota bacterium]